jgi:O-methyltransferase involved in polyketide biosynthesis
MIKDEKAVALVTQMSLDFSRVRQIPMNELLKAMRIIFTREMDRYARDFISRHPDGVVVHIGCGLDSRFERVVERNCQVEWYDLDLPHVIDLRREFIGDEGERYHLLACSVREDAWLEVVKVHSARPILFLAETVFVYFMEAQVKSLVLTLRDHFPGAELVFDGWRPFEVWLGNRYLSNSQYADLMHWGFWRGEEIEGWGDDIHLLDEWGFFDQPEPRLASYRWMAPIFRLFKPMRIFHYQLGKAAEQKGLQFAGKEEDQMPTHSIRNLNAVSQTLLIPLYIRAMESQRPDALVRDPKALELVAQLDYDFSAVHRPKGDQVNFLLRIREFDRQARAFLAEHPDGVIVDLGCGLDTRFDRVDNGQLEWYGLDLPEVIELRKELLDETPRSRFIGCSVLDFSWMDALSGQGDKHILFLAEAMLVYLEEAEVKRLVQALAERFPGAELVCDAYSPAVVRFHPRPPIVPRPRWGLKDDRDVEAWAPGIRLLSHWYYFDEPEPRLGALRLMRTIPFIAKMVRIVHYRLGEAAR